jgi:hypothetical protein
MNSTITLGQTTPDVKRGAMRSLHTGHAQLRIVRTAASVRKKRGPPVVGGPRQRRKKMNSMNSKVAAQRYKVLEWRAEAEPSRSTPGTWHVCLSLRMQAPDGTTHNAKVWWTPEHPSDRARHRAMQLGRRLGLPERKCNAHRLAWAIHNARPAEVEAWKDGEFWRVTW